MNKALVVIALASSSLLLGCPDKTEGAKQAPAASAATPAAQGAPAAPAPAKGGGGGW